MKTLINWVIGALAAGSSLAIADSGWWYDADAPGHGLTISQDSGHGHGVLWFLHRADGSSAFLIAGENCDGFPCAVTLHEPVAAWMGGATSLPGADLSLGDPVGSLELTPQPDGTLAAKFDLYYWREDCIGIGPGGAIFRGCVGTLSLTKLAQ